MKKTVKVEKIVEKVEEVKPVKVQVLTQEFGNGDLNTLKDKINEIIKHL